MFFGLGALDGVQLLELGDVELERLLEHHDRQWHFVAIGQTIPVATIGAELPNLTIEPRKMRGVDSQGMMISGEELALPGEWFEDGIMQLDAGTPLGANVAAIHPLVTA